MAKPIRRSLEDRFWEKVQPAGADECWIWTAYRNRRGYGVIKVGGRSGKSLLAHRVAYQLLQADIPDGLQLDHLCRTPACVNPWHLEPVTNRVNALRGVSPAAICAAKTECIYGHPYDAENTYIAPKTGARQCRVCIRERYIRKKQSRAHDAAGAQQCGVAALAALKGKP